MKTLSILLLALCAHSTCAVLNVAKRTSDENKRVQANKDELQAKVSNAVGYQYHLPTNSQENYAAAVQTTAATPNQHYPSAAAAAAATNPASYYYTKPTTMPSTPASHYYLPPTSTATPTHSPSYAHHDYATPMITQHASFSLGGWPLYQHSSQTPGLAVSLQDDVKAQQELLNKAPSYFVSSTAGHTNNQATPSFFVPRASQQAMDRKQKLQVDKIAPEMQLNVGNNYDYAVQSAANDKFKQVYNYQHVTSAPAAAGVENADSFLQPPASPISSKFVPKSSEWPISHTFDSYEGYENKPNLNTATQQMEAYKNFKSTQATNHNYYANIDSTTATSPPNEIATDKAPAADVPHEHAHSASRYASSLYDTPTRVIQNLHTSVTAQQRQQSNLTPLQMPLNTLDSYLNYRLQQLCKQTAQVSKPENSASALARFQPDNVANFPSSNSASPSSNFFPATTLQLPYASSAVDFTAKNSTTPAAATDANVANQSAASAAFDFQHNQHFQLKRPSPSGSSHIFAGNQQANNLLTGEDYIKNPKYLDAGVDFLQMQSQSYELPTIHSVEPAASHKQSTLSNFASAPQQQQYFGLNDAVLRQPHAFYGAPIYASSATAPASTHHDYSSPSNGADLQLPHWKSHF